MERIEQRCWLDWWANPMLVLGSAEVDVTISSSERGWEAHGHLVSNDQEDREGFAFLCDIDPVFSLRFADESTITVNVLDLDEHGQFTLTEYTDPTQRKIDYSIDLRQPGDNPNTSNR